MNQHFESKIPWMSLRWYVYFLQEFPAKVSSLTIETVEFLGVEFFWLSNPQDMPAAPLLGGNIHRYINSGCYVLLGSYFPCYFHHTCLVFNSVRN